MSGVIISKPGKVYSFRKLQFFAERGSIHLLDFRVTPYDPTYKVESVTEMLLRARALNAQTKRFDRWPREREEHVRLVESIIACCKEAQKQGRPDDPRTWEHIRAMRDKHLLRPGANIQAGNYKVTP